MICLRITLLGGFTVASAAGEQITLKGRKIQALLACLAMKPGEAWPRDKLCGLLWSERGVDRARGSLRQALSKLHKALGGLEPDPLNAERNTVSLNASFVDCDVARFIALAENAGPMELEQAAALYRGELLDGLGMTDPSFEEWLDNERRSFTVQAQDILGALLDHQQSSGAPDKAIITARGLLAIDPLQEAVHRNLMSLYVAQGNRAMALKQYQACRGVLKTELGIAPAPETDALSADILHYNDVPLYVKSARAGKSGENSSPGSARQTIHRRAAVYQYVRRRGAGLLCRRRHRGHHHRAQPLSRALRHRPQLVVHL
jgi:DNA-binding SARP family transcriptional activator